MLHLRRSLAERRLQEVRKHRSMLEAGWCPWPPGASIDEMGAAMDSYRNGGRVKWYPPRAIAPRRKLFGLF